MTLVIALAVGAAAINVAIGQAADRLGRSRGLRWYSLAQGLALLVRFTVFFATAHAVFSLRLSPVDVTIYIFVAAILQLAGLSYFLLRKKDGSGE